MANLTLAGCMPEPIASYLKALAVLRLVSEQKDPDARGLWSGEHFQLSSSLTEDDVIQFFLEEYEPTPIIAPWNGGSGFFPKDNKSGIGAIEQDRQPRFDVYRSAVATARNVLAALDVTDKPTGLLKETLIERLRDELDDRSLLWLDAAIVMTGDALRFPPLLGSGGNDGRLDFTNNQMQRLAELLIDDNPNARDLLVASLFGRQTRGLTGAPIGQFSPGQAGGANAAPGFDGGPRVNPWDYVLLLEGALLFASRVTRRLEATGPGELSYPFSVRASGTAHSTTSEADEGRSRHELWLPLWTAPARLAELSSLFSEGRARVGSRTAVTGVDFARAVSSLGVDRGIDAFVRYGFHVRNGLAYFATPLERWSVARTPRERVALLLSIDGWVNRIRSAASAGPASIRAALRRLEVAVLDVCRLDTAAALQQVLIALGDLEQTLARSRGFTDEKRLTPVPLLSPEWFHEADDGSIEYALAAALASTGVREHLVPIDLRAHWTWQPVGDPRVVWSRAPLVDNLIAVIRRRLMDADRQPAEDEPVDRKENRALPAALDDIGRFIGAALDDDRIEALLRGLACVDWRRTTRRPGDGKQPAGPALYPLLKLVHDRAISPDVIMPRCPEAFQRAASGDALGATTHAIRRLRASGLRPVPQPFAASAVNARRTAAALLFPITERSRATLLASVTVPSSTSDSEPEPETVP